MSIDIYDFLEYRRLKNFKELESIRRSKDQAEVGFSENKLNYERKKQIEKDIRKLKTQIKKTENKISEVEERIAETNNKLSHPEGNLDFNRLSKDLDKLNKELELEMANWEDLHLKLEKLRTIHRE